MKLPVTLSLAFLLLPAAGFATCNYGKIGGLFGNGVGPGAVDAFQDGTSNIRVNQIGDGLKDLIDLNADPNVYVEEYPSGRKKTIKYSQYTKAVRDCNGKPGTYPDWFPAPNVVPPKLTVEQQAAKVPAAVSSSALGAHDLNGDGRVDLVKVRFGQGVGVSLNTGAAELPRAGTLYPAGTAPETLLLAEVNGDGQADLLVADSGNFNTDTGGLAVLIGMANGAFAAPVRYGAGVAPRSVTAADFNNDGRLDAAVASLGSYGSPNIPVDAGGVYVLLNTGNGRFGTATRLPAGEEPTAILDADFNGDGRADLAVANDSSGNLSIFLGNGDGTFQVAPNVAVGVRPTFLGTADFNGDGRADLAVHHRFSATISMWMNNGSGGFVSAGRYQTGSNVESFEIVDGPGDARPTILSPDQSGGRFLLLGVDLAGTLAAPPVYPVANGSRSVAAADFDRNGALDLAVATPAGMAIIANPRPRQFPQPAPTISGGAASRASWVAAADLTGDGILDLAGANGNVFVMTGMGDGRFGAPAAIPGGVSSEFVAAADLNGDGRSDLVAVESQSPTGNVAVYLAGGGGFTRTAYPVGVAPRQAAVADFNGDGRPDLAVANFGNLQTEAGVSLLLASGPGVYRPATRLSAGLSIDTVATGDFNGDGKADLAAAGQLEGAPSFLFGLRVFLGNGDGTFRALAAQETSSGPTDMEVADFNRDGLLDLAMSHCCGSTDMTMLLGSGDGTFGAISFPGGASPQGLAAGDFDQDGFLDLAVAGGDSTSRGGGVASILDFVLLSVNHVSAASGSPGVQAPDSIISAYAPMLATATEAAPSPEWPATLAGTQVRVRDSAGTERTAGIAFASPGQVNYHMPAESAEGPATVTMTTGSGRQVSTGIVIRRIAPGLFQATASGLAAAWAVRVKPDGTQLLEPVVTLNASNQVVAAPIDLSIEGDIVVLQLYGTGLRRRLNLSDVKVTIGGVECAVIYAGPQNQFPGLDQVNVQLPPSLRGAGLVDVLMEVEGVEANSLQVRIR